MNRRSYIGKGNPNYGKKHSKETREKIKQKAIGRKHTEEWKKKHSETLKGVLTGEKNPMYGMTKELNPNWRGGRVKRRDGYILKHISNNKYELEHRAIMENEVGRELSQIEIVHHINGDVSDNRIDNLKIVTSKEHNAIHYKDTIGKYNEKRKLQSVR